VKKPILLEPSFLLFVFSKTNFSCIRKLPTTLRVHQGEVPVRLLFLGLVREPVEEPLPRLVEPISNLLRNLGVQYLKLRVLSSQIQSELSQLVFTHTVSVSFVFLFFCV